MRLDNFTPMAQRFFLLAETTIPHAGSVATLMFGTQDPCYPLDMPICMSRDSASCLATATRYFVVLGDSSATVDPPTITFGTLAPCHLHDPFVGLEQDGSSPSAQADGNMPCLAPTVTFGTLEPCPLYEPAVGFGAGSRYVSYPAFPRSVADPQHSAPRKRMITFGTHDPCCLYLGGLPMGSFHAGTPDAPTAPVDTLTAQPAHCLSNDDHEDDSTQAQLEVPDDATKAKRVWKLTSRVLLVVKSVITSFQDMHAATTDTADAQDLGTWIETLAALHAELSLHPWRLSTFVPTLVRLQKVLSDRAELHEDEMLTISDSYASMLKALRRRYPRMRRFRCQLKP
ncbi:hypothetical protein SDRG_07152 [Saprolegnia diclina VS20]|uniref:Uncharacterized protein n=1 Tax=Saprolegnia diclina (strain VS20) TaxID=1156394 RepID=T0RYH9_SAPDV|nr:hypothetical protein SDRG_07152 [Saprolegnia diclina VS20]EQC35442.1 hypothetical protein SDRG_07152 [Saprolegnia diclina VS20]|eukprot:XP_008611192.1 hypothetical protein SDRG_07152 [Saprolegnia diclina VS20]